MKYVGTGMSIVPPGVFFDADGARGGSNPVVEPLLHLGIAEPALDSERPI